MRKLLLLLLVVALAGGGVAAYVVLHRNTTLVLTGIVTTNDVIVSPQIGGQLRELRVTEGDSVKRDQLLGIITPDELRADVAYYTSSAQGLTSQVQESEAALRFQQQQTVDQTKQAEATLAATIAQQQSATADQENARLTFERNQKMVAQDIVTTEQFDQSRTAYDAARAKVDSLAKQVEAARSAVALARANEEQVAMKRSQLQANRHQQAAANAQRAKADVRLAYTEIHAPIDGIVDVRAARPGEYVSPGQAILTLINPDDLWLRADVEETYIDRVRIGDRLTVRLPSGVETEGTVFYRGADAGFATQRDVSRTKRDIKTFEIRLRVDNRERRLAVGMTAYVLLPIQ
jgi:multidrug resistance efflux pump